MGFVVSINGVVVDKVSVLNISYSLDQWAGRFNIEFRDRSNSFGINVGNELIVEKDGVRVFGGIVQKFERKNGSVVASGLDFTALLAKRYVNEVYLNDNVSDIVVDIISEKTNLYYTGVYAGGSSVDELRFRNVQVFKALQELSKFDSANFFVDENKNLVFNVLGNVDSGVVLEYGVNVISDSFKFDDGKLANKIKVTGGREDYQKTESFSAVNGQDFFVLERKPVSMRVTVDGVEQDGFKFGMRPTGDFDYFFNTDSKTVSWNVAFSGGEVVVVSYVYQSPVIVESQNEDSINSTGQVYEKVIYDESINTKVEAQALVASLLNNLSSPSLVGSVVARLNFDVDLGELVSFRNSNKGVDDSFIVTGLVHNIFGGSGRTTTFKLSSFSRNTIEVLSEIIQRVEALEELQRGEVDISSILRSFNDYFVVDEDPVSDLVGRVRSVNFVNTWYFGKPHVFSEPIVFGGGSGKYGSNVFTNIVG